MKSKTFGLLIAIAMVLVLAAAVSALAQGSAQGNTPAFTAWYENFDSYGTDISLHGVGGWKGWSNNPAATAYTRDEQRRSLPNSVNIMGASDLVHEYTGVNSGLWRFTAWQYIPVTFIGESYFILLNQYDDTGLTLNWSTQVDFIAAQGLVHNDGTAGGTLPIIYSQWVRILVEIDFEADLQRFYYGGNLLFQGSWTDGVSGGGILNFAAVNLDSSNSSELYYDDISTVAEVYRTFLPLTLRHY